MVRQNLLTILSHDDVVRALKSYRRQHPGFIADGQIESCRVDGNTLSIDLALAVPGKGSLLARGQIAIADLTDPLIRFCLENNIRLPNSTDTHACVIDGEIALQVSLDPERCASL